MATFKKGQSFKGQRVHVSGAFEQKGPGMTGKNVAFSISNDTREPEGVITNPMLVYDKFTDKEGNEKDTYTASYSAKQWAAIEAAANKEGDAMVLEADLFPNTRGKGLVINTNTLKTPDVAFDATKHRENTLAARDAKKSVHQGQEQEQQAQREPALEV
ncbi:hypothetical protein HXA34_20790 [Salipaludibacillus agaradhaerens]|jgi:hypothetical protein|uniref:hypothetical protein n=1 Tax=Salipaludibacillus agaradhaerens TaxID=76935 RepID=UPI0021507808|nr:hypothetical protein [Salipaludibacillus agaradhaerens]MCR6108738.1 hypothetical protein [Salipaludibacillus agaradhaerens]MCR6120761.1 hypothetical protein [Salipaludibacillus agaradhaerens]